jgi:hypothetical protein
MKNARLKDGFNYPSTVGIYINAQRPGHWRVTVFDDSSLSPEDRIKFDTLQDAILKLADKYRSKSKKMP